MAILLRMDCVYFFSHGLTQMNTDRDVIFRQDLQDLQDFFTTESTPVESPKGAPVQQGRQRAQREETWFFVILFFIRANL